MIILSLFLSLTTAYNIPFPSTQYGSCVIHDKILYYVGGVHDKPATLNSAVYSLSFNTMFKVTSPPWKIHSYSGSSNLDNSTNSIIYNDDIFSRSQSGSVVKYNIPNKSWDLDLPPVLSYPPSLQRTKTHFTWTQYNDTLLQLSSSDDGIKLQLVDMKTLKNIGEELVYTWPKFQYHTTILHKSEIVVFTTIHVYRYSIDSRTWFNEGDIKYEVPYSKGFSTVKLNDTAALLLGEPVAQENLQYGGLVFDLDSFKQTPVSIEGFHHVHSGCSLIVNDVIVHALGAKDNSVQLIDIKSLNLVENFFPDPSYQNKILLYVLLSLLGALLIFSALVLVYWLRIRTHYREATPYVEPIWAGKCAKNKDLVDEEPCTFSAEPMDLTFDLLDTQFPTQSEDPTSITYSVSSKPYFDSSVSKKPRPLILPSRSVDSSTLHYSTPTS